MRDWTQKEGSDVQEYIRRGDRGGGGYGWDGKGRGEVDGKGSEGGEGREGECN